MNIAVLVSGGVDSSVALRLLQQQGHQLTAFYLKIWLEDELSFLGTCPWEEDLQYVRRICEQAGIPLEVISLQREYWDEVVAAMIAQIRQGYTPNPDVWCNQKIKFGAFCRHVGDRFDKIATGHYAQVVEKDGLFLLQRSPDLVKDQTYFLSQLSQQQIAKALFPIGHLEKLQVRQYAQQFDLPNKDRKDSQGICFLGKLKFDQFLAYHLGEKPGSIVEYETGSTVGLHRGFWFYTIGQRQGLGLSGGPWFVMSKNIAENIVYVSRSYHASDKIRNMLVVSDCQWISGKQPQQELLGVKLRHGSHTYQSQISYSEQGDITIQLPNNDQGIACGQYAAFYDQTIGLGSGMIVRSSEKA